MVVLLTGPSRHAAVAITRPATAEPGGFPRRRELSCAKERLAQLAIPGRAHRIITGTVSSRGHLTRPAGDAARPGANPRSIHRQARQNLTADLPRARAHQAPPAPSQRPIRLSLTHSTRRDSTSPGVCQCCAMGIPRIAVQLVDEGNSEPVVRFLIEWVSDGEAEARRYLADHAEPDGASLIATAGSDVIGYVAIIWESDYAGFRSRGIPLLHQIAVAGPGGRAPRHC